MSDALENAFVLLDDGTRYELPEPSEYYEGGRAFLNHVSRRDCPYAILERGATRRDPDLAKTDAWCRGWDFAWRADMLRRSELFKAVPRYPPPA